MSDILRKIGDLFYKKKYRDGQYIIRVLCFRFKKSAINYDILYTNDNKVILHCVNGKVINNPKHLKGLHVSFSGKHNVLEIYEPCTYINDNFIEMHGDSCICTLNKCQLEKVTLKMQHSAKCFIDEQSTIYGYIHLANERNLSLTVGKGCMFSIDVAIWGTDGHIIRDMSSNEIINRAKNGIYIGNHCWIGNRVTILKNTILADNTIVGANSLVSGDFSEPNTIIVGNPAKVIKNNVIWDRKPLD